MQTKTKKKPDWLLIALLITVLTTRLFFSFYKQTMLWDSAVYIAMGKYIFSLGNAGLFEHIRPLTIPLLLGLFWKLGLNPAILGKLLEITLFTFSTAILYSLTKSWFCKKTAIITSILFAFSPIFFYLSFHQYTEIPAMFFVLLALWFLNKNFFWTGIFIGAAFLTKFPAGIFLPIILIAFLIKKQIKNLFYLIIGFFIITAPYLIFSWIFFENPLATLNAANTVIKQVLGCNVLHTNPWWFYISTLIKESWFYIFIILGITTIWTKKSKNALLLTLCFLAPLTYLSIMHCKDFRYSTLFLPFAAVLAGKGITDFLKIFKQNKHKKIIFILLTTFIFFSTAITAISFFKEQKEIPNQIQEEFFSYFNNKKPEHEIWISNPLFSANTDLKFKKIYYPVYNSDLSQKFQNYLLKNKEHISYIAIENCGGGIICASNDKECISQTNKMLSKLDAEFKKVFDKQHGKCWYRIWKHKTNA